MNVDTDEKLSIMVKNAGSYIKQMREADEKHDSNKWWPGLMHAPLNT